MSTKWWSARFEAHVNDFSHIKIQSWNTIVQIILLTQRMILLFGQIGTKKEASFCQIFPY